MLNRLAEPIAHDEPPRFVHECQRISAATVSSWGHAGEHGADEHTISKISKSPRRALYTRERAMQRRVNYERQVGRTNQPRASAKIASASFNFMKREPVMAGAAVI